MGFGLPEVVSGDVFILGPVLLDGYVRVSQVAGRGGESFISPSVQREQIEGWVAANGATLGLVFEELDESGGRRDRPKLMEALGRAEQGLSQGIVVAKLDRFGRSLVDGLANIERLSGAGATFVSVQDGLDISTPTGKLVTRIMLSMAEWELDRIRENWAIARSRAVARGVHPGVAPIGYRRRKDGRLAKEEPAASVIGEVFRRRAEGETLKALLDLLNHSGLKTKRGSEVFVESSLRGMLSNRVYLGEVHAAGQVTTGAHDAIVDRATWQSAQRPLRFESNRRTSLLGGLLRCGSCRMKMSVESGVFRHGSRGGVYRCPGRTSAGPCPSPARVRGEEIEGIVEAMILTSFPRGRSYAGSSVTAAARSALVRAERALERYRDDSGAVTTLTPENFAGGLARRQADVERAAVRLGAAQAKDRAGDLVDPELADAWPELSIAERRARIDTLLDAIVVLPGKEPVVERAFVLPRGVGPVDFPRRGSPIGSVRPFEPRACPGARRLRRPRRLVPRRIEDELRAWRGAEDRWPTYVEFLLAGRAHLHHQVVAFGGVSYWAHRLGWGDVPRMTAWNEETIEAGLRPLLAGRAVWPSAVEFESAGLGGLRRAVIRHGGIAHWAGSRGLAMRPGATPGR